MVKLVGLNRLGECVVARDVCVSLYGGSFPLQ